MTYAEDFSIRDKSALSSGSQLDEEHTSQNSSRASAKYSCLGTAAGRLMAVQEHSCQVVVTTSDLAVAPDGKRLEEESILNLHSDSLSNASFLLSTIQVVIYILTQT
jgi:hypothetical protein